MKPKSATTAGLLGIFLGSFGAHDFYLGGRRKKLGIAHVCLFVAGLLMQIIAAVAFANTYSSLGASSIWEMMFSDRISSLKELMTDITVIMGGGWFFIELYCVGILCIEGTAVWGFIEGMIILTNGDAKLAAEGYPVKMPMPQQYSPQGNGVAPQPVMPQQNNSGLQGGGVAPQPNNDGLQQGNADPQGNGAGAQPTNGG